MVVEMKEGDQQRAVKDVQDDVATTLHTDTTTKHGHKYAGYQVTLAEGSFHLAYQR